MSYMNVGLFALLATTVAHAEVWADDGGGLSLLQVNAHYPSHREPVQLMTSRTDSTWMRSRSETRYQNVAGFRDRHRNPIRAGDWQMTNVLSNNLGGQGPDTDAPEGIRYGDVAVVDGVSVDLVVNAQGNYVPCDVSKNGLHGSFGNINLNHGEKVSLTFSFVDQKGNPVRMPAFQFSVFDLDQGPDDQQQEWLITSGFSRVKLMDPSSVKRRQLADGRVEFKSSRHSGYLTNPTDPTSLTESQAAESIQFEFPEGTSQIAMEYQISNGHTRGRNILFAGMSSLAFCNLKHAIFDMNTANVKSSNLGNKGPDFSAPEGVHFANVMRVNGRYVDMFVHSIGEYFPQNISQNRLNGNFVQINMRYGSENNFLFKFQDSENGQPVKPDFFYFTIFDIDEGRLNRQEEYFTIGGFVASYLTDETEIQRAVLPDGRVQFHSSTHGIGDDNPKAWDTLNPQQANRVVTFLFSQTSEITANVKQTRKGPKTGRNLLFGGKSSVVFC